MAAAARATASSQAQVRYVVEGTCRVSVTMETDGGTSQRDVTPPWSFERPARRGDFLYLSGQTNCRIGAVGTAIEVWDGRQWVVRKQVVSRGDYVIASVSDTY